MQHLNCRLLRLTIALLLPVAAHAQSAPAGQVVPRLRIAVMDLTGSALDMQTAQVAGPGPGGYSQVS